MTETMRALVLREYGDPDVLRLEEVPRPAPIPTEVRVRVEAAGVNPVDTKTRQGAAFLPSLGEPPWILGCDVAGTVEELGFGVTTLAVGDRVLGMPRFPREAAAYAGQVTSPARQLVKVPEGMTIEEAGALPLAGLTAWQLLVDTADVQPGQRVLVHAAGGGVGHLAVQIAKAHGAHVIGTASAGKHDRLRALGADELVDYRSQAFEDVVSDVDVVVDLLGGDVTTRSVGATKPGGLVIAVPSGTGDEAQAAADARGVHLTGFLVEPDERGLLGLVDLYVRGELRIDVEDVLPLAEGAEAHRRIEAGRTTGKLVLRP